MKISILAVQTTTQTSKAGKPYQQAEVTFKNLTFNKVESKKLMPFGANKNAFDALVNSKAGDVFEVTVEKNAQGYNDWPTVVQAAPGSTEAAAPAGQGQVFGAKGSTTTVKSTYETPDERAKKQVYIIKQSSFSSAATLLTTGAKSPPSPDAVFELADKIVAWVLGTELKPTTFTDEELFDQPNDLEVM